MTLSNRLASLGASALAFLTLAAASSANAHVSLAETEAAAGTTYRAVLRVPHGCDGEATRTLRVQLPDGFYAAQPMPKPGWDLETGTGPYATPFDNHGTVMTEGVREMTWSGGDLPDAWYDEFIFRGRIGAELPAGTVLHFQVVQECASGTADWTDTSGAAGVDNPAPALTVVAGEVSHHGHGAPAHEHDGPWTVGALTVTNPYSRATLPNAPVGGGFLTVTNSGTADDVLQSASSDAAGHMEVHQMSMQGDVMRMRPLADGLPIPAGETVEMKPGGYHLMFMDLKHPLVEGETVAVTLTFRDAGELVVPLTIGAPNANAGTAHGGHAHDKH